MIKFKLKIIIALVVVVALVVAGAGFRPDRFFEIARSMQLFADVFRGVNEMYVEELNPNTLLKTGADEMLDGLDPYTNFFPEDFVEDMRTLNTGQYGGIGAETKRIDNRTFITRLLENGPAVRSGMVVGDEVMSIDGIMLSTLTVEEANKLVRGQTGTAVTLIYKHTESGTSNKIIEKSATLKREKIQIPVVPFSGMLDNKIGYTSLSEFNQEAASELKKSIDRLKKEGATALILDLRGNPGGLLQEAVSICGFFIPTGKLVVTTKGKTPESNSFYTTRSAPIDEQIPLVVLIDRGSASASEIVSGTLQDYDRAVVVGERSFGKGLVQTRRALTYNSVAMITTAKYYTPSGRCIQVVDYSNRREDGSVGKIADSLRKAFKTTGGRTVFDGGGIEPDVLVERAINAELEKEIRDKNYFFEFANKYYYNNPQAMEYGKPVGNLVYPEFVKWMGGKKLDYKNDLEKKFEETRLISTEEDLASGIKSSLDGVAQKISALKKRALDLNRPQLEPILARELHYRYFPGKPIHPAGIASDETLARAISVLSEQESYRKILGVK
ncbi:MAG: S41 family peptidase [Bacteroidetes bacterium]|nr:S41 family peptidase [Bacteroidota bacterium]